MDDIVLPRNAFKYILLQRTELIDPPIYRLAQLIKKLVPFISHKRIVFFMSAIVRRKILLNFNRDMQLEYNVIRDHLPNNCFRILDIGCGIAGIDIFIYNHYSSEKICFFLLDKSQIDTGVHYGFKQHGEFYNSLSLAKKTMVLNGIPGSNINLLEATENGYIAIKEPVDLVLSLISWGFHYPVSTYLDNVYEILSDKGVLILDVRKGTDGIQKLENKFGNHYVICDRQKYQRVICRRV